MRKRLKAGNKPMPARVCRLIEKVRPGALAPVPIGINATQLYAKGQIGGALV